MSSNLSRRSFLKGAAALAVVSAASGVLAGCSATGVGGTVSGTGATRSFTDGENVITITNTDFDLATFPGSTDFWTMPTFKVKNDSKNIVAFVGDSGKINSSGYYTIVATACFDGKLPEAKPETIASLTGSKDFSKDTVSANSTVEGVLGYKAPFKNWNNMKLTMTLYKKDKDGQTVTVGSTTYTFNQ